jgi:hypothetical protein
MALKKTAKRTRQAAQGAKKAASKAVGGAAKRVKKAVSNPKRTVRRAAENVHTGAARARKLGDSVVTAGELIKQTADFVDSISRSRKPR